MNKVLILGGTAEAIAEAERLVGLGHDVTTSLAGRTREPLTPPGRIRIGGFGGAEGLADYVRANGVDELVDATHPYAVRISANARQAASTANVPLRTIERPPWPAVEGDRWHSVASIEEAVEVLTPAETVLLALGAQHIAPFSNRADVDFIVRMVDPPPAPPWPGVEVVVGRPGPDVATEMETLRRHGVQRIVCRNSGGEKAYRKIEAARALAIPIVMIERRASP